MATILLTDDEVGFRNLLKRMLELEGYQVEAAGTVREAIDKLKNFDDHGYSLVLSDVRLPDGVGFEILEYVNSAKFICEFILMTAYGTIPDGVKAVKMGAFDYLTKTDDKDRLLVTVARAIEKSELRKRVHYLENQTTSLITFEKIIGLSPALNQTMNLARKVAASDTPVLITGETGTGKELLAQAIHMAGNRKNKNFVALNCSAFPAELLESELFGYKKGAFTGAVTDKRGLIEEADGGTLFLDEIGEMPAGLQAKLLRFLETQTFIKIGSVKSSKVDVRILSATHRNLLQESESGQFRSDLYYRLSVFKAELPPLRNRPEDIPLLVHHFADFFIRKMNRKPAKVTDDFMHSIQSYHWRGNIRELKNVIERAVILCDDDLLTPDLLPPEFLSETTNYLSLDHIEKQHILKVYRMTGKNKTDTAHKLGISSATLYRKLEEYKSEEKK